MFINQYRQFSKRTTSNLLEFDKIPGPQPLPFIGNLWRYFPLIGDYKPDSLFENALLNKNRYGPIVREKLNNSLTILHLFDPDDIEAYSRQDGKYPYRRSHRALLKYRRERPLMYNDGGLFPENGENWHRQRTQFQRRLLSKSEFTKSIGALDQVAIKTVESLVEQHSESCIRITNLERTLYRWALGNTIKLFLDTSLEELNEKSVQRVLENLHNALTAIDKTEIQKSKWLKEPEKCRHYKMLVESQNFLWGFVQEHVNKVKPISNVNRSYLQSWTFSDNIDKRDIVTFIIDGLLAGLHTTSYTTAFLLYHLAGNPDVQEALLHEIDDLIEHGVLITINDIDKMAVMRNCLKEVFRLNPVSIGTGRLTNQDNLIIRNFKIPIGTMVITHNQVASLDETVFEDPFSFKPERWNEYRNQSKAKRPSPFTSLPFGFGARSCIGQRLAELQIKIFTARLLKKFRIVSMDKVPIKTTLIHNIGGPVSITLKKRDH